jgi:anti-sigma factor RsiW
LDASYPESYVRGKLDDREREEFEVHLLDCDRCFEEVRLAERYVAGLKGLASSAVLRAGPSAASAWEAWLRPVVWVPLAAAALILVLAGLWLGYGPWRPRGTGSARDVLARAHRESMAVVLALRPAGVNFRGVPVPADLDRVRRDAGGRVALLWRAVPGPKPEVDAEVLSADGRAAAPRIRVEVLDRGERLSGALWEPGTLPSGTYRLVVRDAEGTEVGSAWFALAP